MQAQNRQTIQKWQSNVRLSWFANLHLIFFFLKKTLNPKRIRKHIFVGGRNQMYGTFKRTNRTPTKAVLRCSETGKFLQYLSCTKQELKAELFSITLKVLPKFKEKISSRIIVQLYKYSQFKFFYNQASHLLKVSRSSTLHTMGTHSNTMCPNKEVSCFHS